MKLKDGCSFGGLPSASLNPKKWKKCDISQTDIKTTGSKLSVRPKRRGELSQKPEKPHVTVESRFYEASPRHRVQNPATVPTAGSLHTYPDAGTSRSNNSPSVLSFSPPSPASFMTVRLQPKSGPHLESTCSTANHYSSPSKYVSPLCTISTAQRHDCDSGVR